MPVSKKRKPKRKSGPLPRRTMPVSSTAPEQSKGLIRKKDVNWQRIAIYVISIVMILSLAIGYLVGNSPPPVPTPTLPAVTGTEVPAPAEEDAGTEESTEESEATTPEATAENQ